jgi:hypothetical protein
MKALVLNLCSVEMDFYFSSTHFIKPLLMVNNIYSGIELELLSVHDNLLLLKYICWPVKAERRKRRKMAREHRDRRKPTLFNQLAEEARNAREPPSYKVAHFRKIITSDTHNSIFHVYCIFLR